MIFKRNANKALALLLSLSLAMSTNMPMGVLANEAAAPETESAAAEITYVMSGEEAIGINLNANPVVIQEAVDVSGNTVPGSFNLVCDANRNGKVDAGEEKLAIEGETAFDSALNVYGVYNVDTTENILITMESGEVANIYGLYKAWGEDVDIYINGGNVTDICAVYFEYSNEYDGNVKIIVSESASVANAPEAVGSYVYHYGNTYVDYAGALQIGGDYTFEKDITLDSLNLLKGTYVIPSGVSVTVGSLITPSSSYSTANIITKGTLNVNSAMGSGKFIMAGGTISGAGAEGLALFHKVEIEKSIENAPLSVSAYGDCFAYEDDYYVKGGGYTSVSASLQGYDVYYSINEAEYKQVTGSFYIDMPETGILKLAMEYVPKQITVENKYSAPKGVVGQTYTADNPLCDLSIYPITNDTTEEYGEVKYAIKKSTPLPAGLSLVKGKIIGTPTKACEDGQKVTVVVTGRNGSTANLELVIRIVNDPNATKGINELVTVDPENKVIHLNGNSVVVVQDSSKSSSYSQIFLDQDHDKLPDNSEALLIGESVSHYTSTLKNYGLIGYSNADSAYKGDISITVKNGTFKNIYGILGEQGSLVSVEGAVSVYMEGGSATTSVYGSYYGEADNVTLSVTAGNFGNVDIYGAYASDIDENLNFMFSKTAIVQGTSTDNFATVGVAEQSIIGGDVNAVLGFESTSYGFLAYNRKYNTEFTGVSGKNVDGSILYDVDGAWIPGTNTFVQDCTVGKDVEFDVAVTNLPSTTTFVVDTTIGGDLTLNSDEAVSIPEVNSSLISATSAEKESVVKGNLYVDIPKGNMSTGWEAIGENAAVEKSVYINNIGFITIDTPQPKVGEEPVVYTIDEDVDASTLSICDGANVVISENTKVSLSWDIGLGSGAKLVNNGTLDVTLGKTNSGIVAGVLENKGILTMTPSSATNWRYHLNISESGKVLNQDNGVWNVACYIKNSGLIVNHGSFVQTYSYATDQYYAKLGTIYTSRPLKLSAANGANDMYYTYGGATPNSSFYYAVNIDYPVQCAAAPQISYDDSVTYDGTTYVRVYRSGNGTSTFTVTPGAISSEIFELESVTYGSNAVEINGVTENDVTTYTASTDGLFEPMTITLNYAVAEGKEVEDIILDLSEDTISELTVGNIYTEEKPLYDLSKVGITGDLNGVEGKVLYSVKDGTLPEGVVLKGGKLYGTLTTATEEETKVVFVIQGLNLTTAEFTLTFEPIAKAVPEWEVPTGFTTTIQSQVQDIELPTSEKGTYAWGSVGESVGNEVGTITTNLIFTPEDTDNYDWAAAAQAAGMHAIWNEEDQTIICVVSVQVEPGEPEVTAPAGLAATYGQTFADIAIPTDENGTFAWDSEYHESTDFVGEVGEHTCYVTYIPTSKKYKTKTGIEVTLTVTPATPTYQETLTEVTLFCDETLGDVLLPDVDGGRYQWVSATSIEPEDGESYSVIYLPEDTVNYDWSSVDGWHKYRKGVVFSVQVTIEHAWGEGVVTKPATEKEEGVKTYTCGLCDATRTETIPKLPNSGGGNGGTVTPPSEPVTPQPPKVGYTLSDSGSKAVYKVSKVGAEVTYVKPDKKTYAKVKVPKTVKYEGVTYKVTAIANNAFKNNTKMTKVTIGANVKTIGNSAFQGCTSLKSITIPKNVTKIGKKAFFGCKKLMKMTIKTTKLTEKSVGKKAFTKMGSSNYKKVVVKVPKKQKKAYTKWLKKRGLNKNAKIK